MFTSIQPVSIPSFKIPTTVETTVATTKIYNIRSSKHSIIISQRVYYSFPIGSLVPKYSLLFLKSTVSLSFRPWNIY